MYSYYKCLPDKPSFNTMHISNIHSDDISPRNRILLNAETLIVHRGYHATGINEILSASGVSKGSFYYYFPSKEALLSEVLISYFEKHIRCLNQSLTCSMRADERILRYFHHWQVSQQKAVHYQTSLMVMLSAEVAGLSEAIAEIYHQNIQSIVTRLAVVINQGKREGSIVSMLESMQLAQSLLNMWLGAALMVKINKRTTEFDSTLKITHSLIYSRFY